MWIAGTDLAGRQPHIIARAGDAYVLEGWMIFPEPTIIENIKVAERRPAQDWPLDRLLEFSRLLPPP